MARSLAVRLWGRTAYEEALRRQLDLVQERRRGEITDTLVLTEHDPVVTLGRASTAADVPAVDRLRREGIALHEVSRGGRATYHGPGQLVGYPIIDLRDLATRPSRPPEGPVAAEAATRPAQPAIDLHAALGALESGLVAALLRVGVAAHSRPGLRGVWVGPRKIASLGIAVRHWISYHGFALNVDCDLGPFKLIVPCGLSTVELTSISEELGAQVDRNLLQQVVVEEMAARLGYDTWHCD